MIDLYIRPDEEESEILEINDYLFEFIEQIEVLLFTEPGEVLGEPEFGIDLERYVHELIQVPQSDNGFWCFPGIFG